MGFRKPVLAVQWDRSTVDYLLAQHKGGKNSRIEVLAAGTVDYGGDEQPGSVGETIVQILDTLSVRKVDLVVGLSRVQVDVLPLHLPPASDEELPVLVNNQVVRDAGELAESGVIDFVPTDGDDEDGRSVFAFIVESGTIESIQAECTRASLKPQAILYRPLASIALLRHVVRSSTQTMTVVTLHNQEADVSIVRGDRFVYTRTVRLGKSDNVSDLARKLVVEIRRSLAAASLATDSEDQHIYLFGSRRQEESLVQKLADSMDLPVSLLDPMQTETQLSPMPEQVSCLTPLLGMVMEYDQKKYLLNFLDPKKPPAPPNYWRRAAIYGAAALVVVAVGAYRLWEERAASADELAQLQRSLKHVSGQLQRVKKSQMQVEAVRLWENDNVNWLDELYDITRRFPVGADAMVRRLSASLNGKSGRLDMSVQARDTDVITELGDRIRDPHHAVLNKRVSEQRSSKTYPWQFDTQITLNRRDPDQYRQANGSTSIAAKPIPKQQPESNRPETTQPVSTEKK